MKTNFKLLAISLLALILSSSCSIHKRHYLPGYQIDWRQSDNATAIPKNYEVKGFDQGTLWTNHNKEVSSIINEEIKQEKASIKFQNNSIRTSPKNRKKLADTCDQITFKDGREVAAKVLEIGPRELTYKPCNPAGNVTYVVDKASIFSIKYPNGEKEMFKSTAQSSDLITGENNGGKSQLVALLLCIFLGGLGIHRFYLGHTLMGVLYLLTGGLCGIGWIIDTILILTGSLKPKNGEYASTL